LVGIAGAALLIVCCCCLGLFIGLMLGNGKSALQPLTANLPGLGGPTATPTVDKNAPVPLKKPGLADNGLEVTVTGIQRPLKVEGNVKLPPDQQFILVTVRIRNTKNTGAALPVAPSDFTVKGDGGLTYAANPPTVTIPKLLTPTSLAPAKEMESELIFQIASDDSGLRLQWKVGGATRVFALE